MSRERPLPIPPGFLRQPVHLIALGLGAGCVPRAPGTAGTVVGVALFLAFRPMPVAEYLFVVAVMFAAGVLVCGRAAAALRAHDHPAIVWDEVVGFLIAMAAVPRTWPWVLSAFVLFRIFDIAKPWPIGWLDRQVSGGLGIMLDDAVAGLMACACLHVTAYVI
jgi:phosphatidylglycerophosphatase A